ncbi:hypothetical protein E1258_27695 [Micromonospora sp. KC207]|uniref:hypothetical protein n=1 Tax=Micromonospora sp. KC207 TaxID=2530377 RepID=UPI001043FBC8|nr:hypothetical protein [Micromonospora sp. KC207]TDC48817.1 hypothetical protein E1258_27695 [Micromonospora sp. KC207]
MSQHHDDVQSPARPGTGYPVVDSAELNPVERRLFRRARRELRDIPKQPPGTVLVFQHGDTYETLPDGGLRLDDEIVVDAVAVAVVSTRHTLREAVAYLPTADPRTCVLLRARFHCWVTDPQLVLDAGCWDIEPLLTDHLVADRRLRFLAQATDPHTGWEHFHRNAMARIFAYHDVRPMIVPGLRTQLVDVALEPQRLATVPRARTTAVTTTVPPDGDGGVEGMPDGGAFDAPPADDGSPAFMPDNYTWGNK